MKHQYIFLLAALFWMMSPPVLGQSSPGPDSLQPVEATEFEPAMLTPAKLERDHPGSAQIDSGLPTTSRPSPYRLVLGLGGASPVIYRNEGGRTDGIEAGAALGFVIEKQLWPLLSVHVRSDVFFSSSLVGHRHSNSTLAAHVAAGVTVGRTDRQWSPVMSASTGHGAVASSEQEEDTQSGQSFSSSGETHGRSYRFGAGITLARGSRIELAYTFIGERGNPFDNAGEEYLDAMHLVLVGTIR